MPELTRTLKIDVPPLVGADVEGATRGMIRYLNDGKLWQQFTGSPEIVRRTWGFGKRTICKRVQAKAGIAQSGVLGPATDRVLEKADAYDLRSEALFLEYQASQVKLCYPHPVGAMSTIGQGLHVTAGLPGNWAFDFMSQGGTLVLAVEDAEVVKISGHPPTYVVDPSTGIFGFNLHYWTSSGYRWFSTHYGSIRVREGQRVKCGQVVGVVGNWPGDPGRSHTHLGVTSPKGWGDAQHRIESVARAPRVPVAA